MKGICIQGLSKSFGDVRALDNVSLTLSENRIYGLLGRNGAGKSTLLNILSGRLFADAGTVTIDGLPAQENDAAQGLLYLMSEKNCYPEGMRVREVLHWAQRFYPAFDRGRAERLADLFALNIGKKVRALSTGYASIFKIIIALCANTPYVLLDEPVLGLDANHRELFYRVLIEQYAEHPQTILISTHLIEEVKNVVEHVIIVKDGRILRDESVESLLAAGYTLTGAASAVDAFTAGKRLVGVDALGGLKTAYVLGERPDSLPEGLEMTQLDLQKLFIQLTNA